MGWNDYLKKASSKTSNLDAVPDLVEELYPTKEVQKAEPKAKEMPVHAEVERMERPTKMTGKTKHGHEIYRTPMAAVRG